MRGGHGDDEGEHVVDERVEGLVHEGAPRQRRHRAQPVVHEQLRQHEQEPERVHAVHYTVQCPRIPTASNKSCNQYT